MTLTTPTEGEVEIFGEKLHGSKKSILSRVGGLIESPGFYPNLTGTENLRIFATLRGLDEKFVKEALVTVSLPYKDKKLYAQYSLGMKQRLAIALSIMHEPDLLILDEPINGLDPIGILEMRKFIKELCKSKGKTVLISSHILSEIEQIADYIGIIDQGVLLKEASIEELRRNIKKYTNFCVSDSDNAAKYIGEFTDRKDIVVVDDNNIQVICQNLNTPEVIERLVMNHIKIYQVNICEESLEDYFRRITGGEGIG